MIFISDDSYAGIARRLLEEIPPESHYFNGRIEYDTDETYSTLTCSAIVYRTEPRPNEPQWSGIEKIVPVWWDFSTCAGGQALPNDFSWSGLAAFFPCHD